MLYKVLLSFFILLNLGAQHFAQTAKVNFSSLEDIKAGMELGPCKGRKERREAVRNLFLKMGAAESDVVIDKIDDVENVVVTLKGKTAETVVVGAHFDKTESGCGVIDNWTGIVLLANLYRTMKNFNLQKTYKFVGFDKEELGLVGSTAMAKAIPKEKRADYCAMVNFDSFGFSYPQVMRNISSDSLLNLAKDVSGEMKIPFAQAAIDFASSDSAPFLARDIPAISFHGLNDKWEEYLHSSSDKLSNVNMQSLYIAYRHGLVFLSKIENKPCGEFRKSSRDKKP